MGQVLYNYYVKAAEIGGIRARTRLSILTKLSSTEILSLPDSAEHIALFEKALATIRQEAEPSAKTLPVAQPLSPKAEQSPSQLLERLRKQMGIFADLTAQRALYSGNLRTTYQRITECIVQGIGVERASLWFYDAAKTGITCADLFISSTGEHTSGVFLAASDYPTYFQAINTERTLAAHDAHQDARTKEFSAGYLTPLGINSMLDVPIWTNGQMVGVVCHEHVGPARTWSMDEENFAYLMGNIAAMSIEQQGR